MARFSGKTVVVLGGDAGIGLAAVRQLHAEGARLAVTGRDQATLDAVANETGALAFRSDMGDIDAAPALFGRIARELGPPESFKIDALLVNAGVGGFSSIADLTEAFWDEVHSVNLKGAVFATRAALPHMADGGAIVMTGSIGAQLALPGNVFLLSNEASFINGVDFFVDGGCVELLAAR